MRAAKASSHSSRSGPCPGPRAPVHTLGALGGQHGAGGPALQKM